MSPLFNYWKHLATGIKKNDFLTDNAFLWPLRHFDSFITFHFNLKINTTKSIGIRRKIVRETLLNFLAKWGCIDTPEIIQYYCNNMWRKFWNFIVDIWSLLNCNAFFNIWYVTNYYSQFPNSKILIENIK